MANFSNEMKRHMMKLILMAFLVLTCAAGAEAQNYGFDITLQGGIGIPDQPGQYSRSWQAGPHLGGGFEFTLSQLLSLGGQVEYDRNAVKNDDLIDGTSVAGVQKSGGALDMISLIMFGNFRLFGKVGNTFPYFLVEAGVTHLRIDDQTVFLFDRVVTLTGSSENALRVGMGAGVDIPLSSTLAFTFGGKYVIVLTKGEQRGFVPIEGGFKFVF